MHSTKKKALTSQSKEPTEDIKKIKDDLSGGRLTNQPRKKEGPRIKKTRKDQRLIKPKGPTIIAPKEEQCSITIRIQVMQGKRGVAEICMQFLEPMHVCHCFPRSQYA